MNVTRIYESPRVTQPYSDEQWQDVLALGQAVDADLLAGDVRLTQGGEPTFVSIDERDGAEWNTEALGPTKRGYATELVQRLRAEYGQGGFLHFGQGKWYPGEQLPRWALSIFWREDGQPAWRNPALFADEREPSSYTAADAQRFIAALTARLGLDGECIEPGYEDVWYYLWRERRLPVNVDPFDSRLDDELERARLRKVFEQKLDSVVGYLLPLKPAEKSPGLAAALADRTMVLPRRTHVPISRAIRRWAIACRWTRCPGSVRATIRTQSNKIRLRRAPRCRAPRRCAHAIRRGRRAAARRHGRREEMSASVRAR